MELQTAELREKLSHILGTPISLKHMTSVNTLLKQEIIHNKTQIDGLTSDLIEKVRHVGEWVV